MINQMHKWLKIQNKGTADNLSIMTNGLLQALTDVQNHSFIPTPETREKSIQHLQLPNNIIPVWRPGPAYRIPNPILMY